MLLIGNVTVSSIWKLYADGTRDPTIIAFAQRLVTTTDWFFTLWGIMLLIIGGYGAAWSAGLNVLQEDWIVWAEVMFMASGAIWICVLVPIQVQQGRLAREFRAGAAIPDRYWKLGRRWIFWGVVATVPLVAATWVMLQKSW